MHGTMCGTGTIRVHLGRKTRVDALIERASRRIDREFFFILLEKFLVVVRQPINFVKVFHGSVWAMTSNLPCGMRIHTRESFILAL